MKIWVDADACPAVVKDIVINAANKRAVEAVFVANKTLFLPDMPYISFVQVAMGADIADLYIKENANQSDMVITQDILLAYDLVVGGIVVIDPRGKKYSEDNIGQIVSTRNLMQGLRDTGEITGGPRQFGEREKRAFAAAFDQEFTKLLRKHRASNS